MEALNPWYSSVDGVLFDKSRKTLIHHPNARIAGDFSIPETVTNICENAFYECASLTSVSFPDSLSQIGWCAFAGCTSLTNINLGNGLSRIGFAVFAACTNLTSIRIPKSVIDIDFTAFDSCSNLRAVYFEGNEPYLWPGSEFYGVNSTAYCLPGTVGWQSKFGNWPTIVWQPEILNTSTFFSDESNRFELKIRWASGRQVVVEACTNLATATWIPVHTNTIAAGSVDFSDPRGTNAARFYRLRSL